MNIEHIRAARESLERELAKLFAEFRGKTGLAVKRVSVEWLTGHTISEESLHVIGEAVFIELESI